MAKFDSIGASVSSYRDPMAGLLPTDVRSPSMLFMVSNDYSGTPSGQYAASSLSHSQPEAAAPAVTFTLFGSNQDRSTDYRDPLAQLIPEWPSSMCGNAEEPPSHKWARSHLSHHKSHFNFPFFTWPWEEKGTHSRRSSRISFFSNQTKGLRSQIAQSQIFSPWLLVLLSRKHDLTPDHFRARASRVMTSLDKTMSLIWSCATTTAVHWMLC